MLGIYVVLLSFASLLMFVMGIFCHHLDVVKGVSLKQGQTTIPGGKGTQHSSSFSAVIVCFMLTVINLCLGPAYCLPGTCPAC